MVIVFVFVFVFVVAFKQHLWALNAASQALTGRYDCAMLSSLISVRSNSLFQEAKVEILSPSPRDDGKIPRSWIGLTVLVERRYWENKLTSWSWMSVGLESCGLSMLMLALLLLLSSQGCCSNQLVGIHIISHTRCWWSHNRQRMV